MAGRGGARVGAGRKPKVRMDLGGPEPAVSAVPMPEDLPESLARVWRSYAPLATGQRTLTAQTVPAMLLLCELEAERERLRMVLDRDGRTFVKVTVDGAGVEHTELKSHPLQGDYARLSKQVETLMGRFMLAPFGKPVPEPARVTAPSEDDEYFGGTVIGRIG